MRKIIKITVWITAATVVVFFIAALVLWWLSGFLAEDMCANTVINTQQINNKYKVVVFSRDCGATTSFSTQVSILKADELLPNKAANVFIADTDHGKAPAGKAGGPEVKVDVLSAESIRIRFHPSSRIFKKENMFENVNIKYH